MDSRFSQSARLYMIGMLAAQFVEYAEAEKPTNYFPNTVETIPDGLSEKNSAKHKQSLVYSTVTNSKGKQYFDMTLTLEGPDLVDEAVMQQWFQIVDVNATADLSESDCESSDDFEKETELKNFSGKLALQ